MKTFNQIMQRANEIYKDNEPGKAMFFCFCLGVMQSRMDREDLKLMDEYLYKKQFAGNVA